jgi:general secretion pathway protein L
MKICGLEFDENRVRAALMEETWRGKLALLSCREFLLKEGRVEDPLFKKMTGQADRVVASCPGNLVSSRTVSLPFTQGKKIEQVLPFEIEPLIPFELDQVILSYHPVSRQNDSSRILAALLLKEDFRRLMEKLRVLGVDPHQVEWDGMALFNFSQILLSSPKGPFLLLNMQSRQTTLCFVKGNAPLMVRSIRGGAIDFQERDSWNEAHFWVKELLKTLQVFKNETGEEIQSLLVCGEGSRMEGFQKWISEKGGLALFEWDLAPEKIKIASGVFSGEDSIDPAYIPATGLALKGTSLRGGLSQINFRKEEFAHTEIEKGRKGARRTAAVFFLILLVLALTDLGIRLMEKKNHYEKLSRQVQEEYRGLLEGSGPILNEVDQTRGEISRLKKKELFFSLKETTPLGVLKEMTVQIPKEVKIDINELSVDFDKVRLEGETGSFESLDQIKESLGKIKLFREIAVTDAKMNAEESKVRFKLEMAR